MLLVIGLSTLYLLTANFTSRQSFDTISTALPAWQLAHHHNLDMTAFKGWSDWIIPVGHHWVSNRFPGATFFAVPLYLLPGAGESAPALWPAALAAVVSVTAAVALLHLSLREISRRLGLVMAAAFALGTPAWSVAADALWTHGPAMVALSLVLLGLSRNQPILASVGLALAVPCRPHLGVAGLVIAIYVAIICRDRAWRVWPVIGLAAGTALLLAYNFAVYDQLTVLGGYAAGNAPPGGIGVKELPLNMLGALVSPSRGLLLYTPVILVLLPLSISAWRQAPAWARAAALGGLAYLAVQLYLVRFSGGNRFYSYRVSLEALFLCWPLATVAAAQLVRTGKRWLLALAIIVSVVVTAVGATTDFISVVEISPWRQVDLVEASRILNWSSMAMVGVAVLGVASLLVSQLAGSSFKSERLAARGGSDPDHRLNLGTPVEACGQGAPESQFLLAINPSHDEG
jgi:hypothetical protein